MKQKSILLVDDEKFILSSLSRELASDNFKVTQAASGEIALAKLEEDSFDLVITDLRMPGVSGFQVLEASKRRNERTMVIILTGYADLDSAVDALRSGADDFLQKPCDIDELLCRISNCVAKQDLQRRVAQYEDILPVCWYCKKIRNDRSEMPDTGRWQSVEEYFNTVRKGHVTHGCCPDCFTQQMEKVRHSQKSSQYPSAG
jgi:DNA-binding NtrC family response regulator